MSWIGLRDGSEGVLNPAGLGQPNLANAPDPDTLLTSGTLFIECSYEPGPLPVNILRLFARDPWPSGLTLCLDTDGTLRLLMRHGARHLSRDLATDLQVSESVLQISYTWDCPARRGTLTLYVPDRGTLFQTDVSAPFPLTLRDATRLMADHTLCKADPSLHFAAVSDSVDPAGPMPAIGARGSIKTPSGETPIDTLRPGEFVSTAQGDVAQVRWVGSQVLPARGRFAPCLLRAPYHGASADLLLGRDQRICLSGSDVEYLFGEERVSAAMHHMIDHRAVLAIDPAPQTVRYYHVLLDRHAVMVVNGAPVESFDVSALLADPGVLPHSVLRDLPPELRPVQSDLALPVLRGFEALTLTELATAQG